MRGVIGMFLRRRLRVCEMLFVLLIMPLSKVCPQCQTIVPQNNLCKGKSKTESSECHCTVVPRV